MRACAHHRHVNSQCLEWKQQAFVTTQRMLSRKNLHHLSVATRKQLEAWRAQRKHAALQEAAARAAAEAAAVRSERQRWADRAAASRKALQAMACKRQQHVRVAQTQGSLLIIRGKTQEGAGPTPPTTTAPTAVAPETAASIASRNAALLEKRQGAVKARRAAQKESAEVRQRLLAQAQAQVAPRVVRDPARVLQPTLAAQQRVGGDREPGQGPLRVGGWHRAVPLWRAGV